jgi:hypothetical protein
MFDFIGTLFFIIGTYLVYRFVVSQHEKIVDVKPSSDLAVLQRKQVVVASQELNPVLVIGRPTETVNFNN